MKFVDFNDEKIDLGKRKQAFVRWLMKKKKVSLEDAKLACYKKFYHEGYRGYKEPLDPNVGY